MLNRVYIEGHCLADYEEAVQVSSNNSKFIRFTICQNYGQGFKNRMFISCVMMGDKVEKTARMLTKGAKVGVEGVLNPIMKDGKQIGLNIIANSILFVTPKNNEATYGFDAVAPRANTAVDEDDFDLGF